MPLAVNTSRYRLRRFIYWENEGWEASVRIQLTYYPKERPWERGCKSGNAMIVRGLILLSSETNGISAQILLGKRLQGLNFEDREAKLTIRVTRD